MNLQIEDEDGKWRDLVDLLSFGLERFDGVRSLQFHHEGNEGLVDKLREAVSMPVAFTAEGSRLEGRLVSVRVEDGMVYVVLRGDWIILAP